MEPKKYEEFIDSADILASGITPLLEKEIRELLDPLMVIGQLVGKDTELVNKPSGSKTFRKEDSRIVAEAFAEDEDIPDVCNADFDTFDVTPAYYGGGCPITHQAIMDFDQDLIKWSLRRLARAMAIAADSRILEELLNVTLVTNEDIAGGAGASYTLAHGSENLAGEAIIAVVSVTPANAVTWDAMDYKRGIITFSADPGATHITYIYAGDREYIETEVDGEISYNDVVNAKVALRTDYVTGDGLLIDELTMGSLLKDDKFIDASAFGEQVMKNGLIGKVAGMPVYITDTMYDNVGVVAKWGSEMATVVYKETLKTEVQKMLKRPGDVWVQTWEKSMPAVIQPTWMRIIIGGQIYSTKYVGVAP
jgi:hypothetical protein